MTEQFPIDNNSTFEFNPLLPWSSQNNPWASDWQKEYEAIRENYPTAPEVNDPDPFVRLVLLEYDEPIPPRKFWDTPEMWQRASRDLRHPITLWERMWPHTPEIRRDPEYIAYKQTDHIRIWYWCRERN